MRFLVMAMLAISTSLLAQEPEPSTYLQLKDRLDRPKDGYCIDIPGSGKRYPNYLNILFQSYHSAFSTRRMGEGILVIFQRHATQ